MAPVTQLEAITLISVSGAAGQAVLTVRYYEPSIDAETPSVPLLEAALFFVGFAIFFRLLGSGLAVLAGAFPPVTRFGILLLTPIGLYSAWATISERFGSDLDTATRYMGAFAGIVVGVYPVVLFLV